MPPKISTPGAGRYDASMTTAAEFIEKIRTLPLGPTREQAIYDAVAEGSHVAWELVPVTVSAGGHELTFQVWSDYLSIGDEDDFVRVPCTPITAQRIADLLNMRLLTPKMVDLVWAAADVKLHPIFKPAVAGLMTTTLYFVEHNDQIADVLAHVLEATPPARQPPLIRGTKKDIVRSNRLHERPHRLALYGWHTPAPIQLDRLVHVNEPVQPLTLFHDDGYADYSHGLALAEPTVELDGEIRDLDEVLADGALAGLLSAEGPLLALRYPLPGERPAVPPPRPATSPQAQRPTTAPAPAARPIVQARNFTPVPRSAPRQIDLVVLHTMESAEKPKTAAAVAAWFASPSAPQASAHYCVDSGEVIQCVDERDVAWGAPGANHNGIHVEHAGRAAQGASGWADEYSTDELALSAKLVAQICARWEVPMVFVSAEELLAGARGITTHAEVSAAGRLATKRGIASGMSASNHWDPGPDFPKDAYLEQVRAG